MKCPYRDNFDCPFVDTSIMEKTTKCHDCEYYYDIDEWNKFMMNL